MEETGLHLSFSCFLCFKVILKMSSLGTKDMCRGECGFDLSDQSGLNKNRLENYAEFKERRRKRHEAAAIIQVVQSMCTVEFGWISNLGHCENPLTCAVQAHYRCYCVRQWASQERVILNHVTSRNHLSGSIALRAWMKVWHARRTT